MSNLQRELERIIINEFENQTNFSKSTGILRTAINKDVSGFSKQIPDERFHTYVRSVSPKSQADLITARLKDIIPEKLHSAYLGKDSQTSLDPLKNSLSGAELPEKTREAIRWLATELYKDPELEDVFLKFCKFAGFEPTEKKDGTTKYPFTEPQNLKVAEDKPKI